MPLEGLSQQQTQFNIQMAEAMMGVLRQESIMRAARIEQMTKYLQELEARRHAEAEAKRRKNQELGLKIGTIVASAFAAPLASAALGAGAGTGATLAELEAAQVASQGLLPTGPITFEGGLGAGGAPFF